MAARSPALPCDWYHDALATFLAAAMSASKPRTVCQRLLLALYGGYNRHRRFDARVGGRNNENNYALRQGRFAMPRASCRTIRLSPVRPAHL